MKTSILISAVLLLSFASADALPRCSAAAPNPQGYTYFHFRTNTAQGCFIQGNDGTWTRRTSTGSVHRLIEVKLCVEYIELTDASRELTIRLYDQHCMIRQASTNNEFQLHYTGHWVHTKL